VTIAEAQAVYRCKACSHTSLTKHSRCPFCGDILSFTLAEAAWAEAFLAKMRSAEKKPKEHDTYSEPFSVDDDEEEEDDEEDEEDEDGDDEAPASEKPAPAPSKKEESFGLSMKNLDDVEPAIVQHVQTGHAIFDEMTDGGPVFGTVSGLTAFPGVGKSTLTIELAYCLRSLGYVVHVLSLEEESSRVSARVRRLDLLKKYPAKGKGRVQIVSPKDPIDGETKEQRAKRLANGFNLRMLLSKTKAADVVIVDSAGKAHDPNIGHKKETPSQLKAAGDAMYDRCHATGEFDQFEPCLGVIVLQSTKGGDSAVPQGFVHAIDATYIGEHVTRINGVVDACKNQKKTTGYIRFRSHGKNRDGSNVAASYAQMTAKGLVHISEDDVPEANLKDKPEAKPKDVVDQIAAPPAKVKRRRRSR